MKTLTVLFILVIGGELGIFLDAYGMSSPPVYWALGATSGALAVILASI